MSKTTVTIFDTTFSNCLMNASGCMCAEHTDLLKLNKSASGAIISKTCSLEKRDGNSHPRYYEDPKNKITLNSMGLPNNGYKYYTELIGTFDKPYIMSVAGNYLLEDFKILKDINAKVGETFTIQSQKQLVEINVSCPNIEGKEQLAYNFNDLNAFLYRLSTIIDTIPHLVIGLKLPPYFDPAHFSQLKNVISKHLTYIKFLTAINSVGNTLIVDSETESTIIRPKKGLGGLGGSFVKPVALSNVWQLHQLFNSKKEQIIIIGCGGITSGDDVFQHILCGAHMCQIGSQLMLEDERCFERINNELKQIMNKKEYTDLGKFRGKLKSNI